MKVKNIYTMALALAVLGAWASSTMAGTIETVTIKSGVDTVRVLPGTTGTGTSPYWGLQTMPSLSNPASWALATSITANAAWKQKLTFDGADATHATWINAGGSGNQPSAIYAVPFTVSAALNNATLDLYWLGDNGLGGWTGSGGTMKTEGLYLNDVSDPLAGSGLNYMNSFDPTIVTDLQTSDRHYHIDLPDGSIAPGLNWLFINQTNMWDVSGLIFSLTVSGTPSGAPPVPEPASLGLLSLGALALLRRRK